MEQNNKKRFDVNVHYDMYVPVSVIAENEGEALDLARDEANRLEWDELRHASEFGGTKCCVTEEDSDLTDDWAKEVISAGGAKACGLSEANEAARKGNVRYTCFDRVMHLVKPVEGEEKLKELALVIRDMGLSDLLDFGVENGCFTKEQSSTLFDGIVMWEDLECYYWEEDYGKFMALQEAMGMTEEIFDQYKDEDNNA